MTRILVDSSVWIDYFKGKKNAEILNALIDDNFICINNLILAEIVPYLKIQKQKQLIDLLCAVRNIPLNIDWHEIIEIQTKCILLGINKIGISDLLITQNALHNNLQIFSFDKHFSLMKPHFKFSVWHSS